MVAGLPPLSGFVGKVAMLSALLHAPPGASADPSVTTPVKPPLPVTPDGVQAAPPPPRLDFGSDEDFQLKQALNQLKGSPVITSTKALQAQAAQTQAVPAKP